MPGVFTVHRAPRHLLLPLVLQARHGTPTNTTDRCISHMLLPPGGRLKLVLALLVHDRNEVSVLDVEGCWCPRGCRKQSA